MALLVCSLAAGFGCSASVPECISPEKYRVLEAALAQGAPDLGSRERLGIAQAMAEAEPHLLQVRLIFSPLSKFFTTVLPILIILFKCPH